jgi:hypothetical protein
VAERRLAEVLNAPDPDINAHARAAGNLARARARVSDAEAALGARRR